MIFAVKTLGRKNILIRKREVFFPLLQITTKCEHLRVFFKPFLGYRNEAQVFIVSATRKTRLWKIAA